MTIYFSLIIFLLFLFYHYDVRKSTEHKLFFYACACIILILVAGFRYRIGYDTTNYMLEFSSPYIPYLSEFSFWGDYDGDKLWILINSFAKETGAGFYTVQLIQAIIVNVAVFWFIKRHSPMPFLGILLYFLFQWWNYCFEAMRESISIAFYLFALDALITENSYKKYYLRVWPAIFAHTFGFITLILPLIKYIRINKFFPLIVVGFGATSVLLSDILNGIVENLVFMQFDSAASGKMVKYMASDVYGEANLSLAGIISLLISRVFPISVFIYVLHKNRSKHTDVFIPYLITYIFVVFLRISVPIFFRFFNYFEIMLIIAITQAIYITKPKTFKHQLTVLSLFFMIFIRSYELTKPEGDAKVYNRYIPYNSILTEDHNEASESIFRYY